MFRALQSFQGSASYQQLGVPFLPLVLWLYPDLARRRDSLGRTITITGASLVIGGQGGKWGAAPLWRSNGATGTISGETYIAAPPQWSSFAFFEPPAAGGAFLIGWKDSPGSFTQDRAIYVKADRTVEAYLYDGASKSIATANAVKAGLNIAVARCDGVRLYVRLNDGAEVSVAVSNGGFTGFTGNYLEALKGPITAGGAVNVMAAVGLVGSGFYRRYLSPGEASNLVNNPWAVGARQQALTVVAASRRRQLIMA